MKFLNVIIVLSIALLSFGCGDDSSTNPDDSNGGDSISNALEPISTFVLPDNARALTMLLDYPYIYTAGYGCYLGIIDISDPTNPTLTGSIRTGHPSEGGGYPYGGHPITKKGNLVFVAYQTAYYNTPDTIIAFNVANPSAPSVYCVLESDKWPMGEGYFDFESVYVLDTVLYELLGSVDEYSINSLPNFQLNYTFNIPIPDSCNNAIGSMGINGEYLYFAGVSQYVYDNTHRFWVYDSQTRELERYIELPNDVGCQRMELVYPKAYIWAQNVQGGSDFGNRVVEVNFSNATSPTVVRTFDAFPQYKVDTMGYLFTLNDIAAGSDFLALVGSHRSLLICDFNLQLIKATISGPGDWGEENWAVLVRDSMIYALSTRQLSVYQYSD